MILMFVDEVEIKVQAGKGRILVYLHCLPSGNRNWRDRALCGRRAHYRAVPRRPRGTRRGRTGTQAAGPGVTGAAP